MYRYMYRYIVYRRRSPPQAASDLLRSRRPGVRMFLFVLAAEAASFAIVHATVLPVSGPPVPDGTVVVTDGKIAAVGAGIPIPAGAETIDATGNWLMPGIIDVHSHMGVYPWPDANAHGDGNEAVEAFTPRAWAGDAFDAEDPAIPRARAGGVTTIQVLPGSEIGRAHV